MLNKIRDYFMVAAITGAIIMAFWAGCSIRAKQVERARMEQKAADLNLTIEKKDRIDENKIRGMSDDELVDFLRRGGLR